MNLPLLPKTGCLKEKHLLRRAYCLYHMDQCVKTHWYGSYNLTKSHYSYVSLVPLCFNTVYFMHIKGSWSVHTHWRETVYLSLVHIGSWGNLFSWNPRYMKKKTYFLTHLNDPIHEHCEWGRLWFWCILVQAVPRKDWDLLMCT